MYVLVPLFRQIYNCGYRFHLNGGSFTCFDDYLANKRLSEINECKYRQDALKESIIHCVQLDYVVDYSFFKLYVKIVFLSNNF